MSFLNFLVLDRVIETEKPSLTSNKAQKMPQNGLYLGIC